MTFVLSSLRNTKAYDDLLSITWTHSVLVSLVADLRVGGSGTLVKYKNFHGILTATHVVVDDVNTNGIFSPIVKTEDPTIFLNEFISIKRIIYLETPEGIIALKNKKWAQGALDICLIEVEESVFNYILSVSGKKFIDLLFYKNLYSQNFDKYCAEDSISNWSWAVYGMPREDGTQDEKRFFESRFDGLYVCGGSMKGSTYRTQPLTLVKSPFDGEADIGCHDLGSSSDTLPSQYSGISGGGMWQVSFQGENGKPQAIAEMLFAGICVAEIPESLYSRGPSSLYDVFIKYLDTLQ